MRLQHCIRSLAIASLVLFAVSSTQAQGILDGLNAYWTMDGNGLDTATAIGSTASAVDDNGEIVPPEDARAQPVVFEDGKFGQAAIYDGIESYIAVPDSEDLSKGGQDLSISAWFRADSLDTGWQALIAKGEGSNYRVARQGEEPFMSYAGGAADLRGGPDVDDGGAAWHHLVATTAEGGQTTLWVDGALAQTLEDQAPGETASIVNERSSDPAALWIGNNPGAPGREWEGGIDDVAIWGRVLSDGEIAALWNGGDGATVASLVPEPASGLLLVMSMLGLLAASRKRV